MEINRANFMPTFILWLVYFLEFQRIITAAAEPYVDILRKDCRSDCQKLLLALPTPEETFNTCDWNCKKQECQNGCDNWKGDTDMSFVCLSICSVKNFTCSSGCRDMEARKLAYIRGIVKRTIVKKSQVTFNGVDISWELNNIEIAGVTWAVELKNMESKNSSWSIANENLGGTGKVLTISIPIVQLEPTSSYQVRLVAFYKDRRVDFSDSVYLKTIPQGQAPKYKPLITQQLFIKPYDNFLICWEEVVANDNLIKLYNVKLEDDKQTLLLNESTNSTCFMFSQLTQNANYKISVASTNKFGSSPAANIQIAVPKTNLSQPILYFANKTHLMTVNDISNYHETPKVIYESKNEITALNVMSDVVFISTANQIIRLDTSLAVSTPAPNVKIILSDQLNRKIYLFAENRIFLCGFDNINCTNFLITEFPITSAVLDIITGYVYFSTTKGLFRFDLGNSSTLERIDIFPNHPCTLALDYATSHLVCNYKEKIYEYNLIMSKIKDYVKSDHLQPHNITKRSYDNMLRMVAWKNTLIWISNSCKGPNSEGSCLFTDEKNPNNGLFVINQFILSLPPTSALIDLGFGFEKLSPVLLPPSNVSTFFSADATRVVWNKPVNLPFQSLGFVWKYDFQLEISGNPTVLKIDKFEYLFNHGSLKPKTKLKIKIKTCHDNICSQGVETTGRTFDTGFPLKSTDIIAVTSHGATVFTLLGENVTQVENFNQNGKNLFVTKMSSTTSNGLILSSNGTLFAFDTVSNAAKILLKYNLYNVTSMDFETVGNQLYWSDDNGIYRTSFDSTHSEMLFPETGAKFLTTLSNKKLIIVGTSSNVYSLFLTGGYNVEYFFCATQDCIVVGVTLCDKDIYYIYRRSGILTLETISFDGSQRKQILVDFINFPLRITKLGCFFGKFMIATDDGRIGIFDPDDGQTNYLHLDGVQDFCVIQKQEIPIDAHLPSVNGVNFALDKDGDETLKWSIESPVPTSTFYKIQIYNSKDSEDSFVAETITDKQYWEGGLNFSEITVTLTVFNYWQTNTSFWPIRPPVSYPSRCKNPRIYVSKVKNPTNITSTMHFIWDPPMWNGFPKGYKVFCWSFTGTTNPIRNYLVTEEINPNIPMYTKDNLPIGITIYCQVTAINVERNNGSLTSPVNASTADDHPAPLLLLSTLKSFGLFDTDKSQFIFRSTSSTNLVKSISQIDNQLFMIAETRDPGWGLQTSKAVLKVENKVHKDSVSGTSRLVTSDIKSLNQLVEVPTGLESNVQLTTLTADWVGKNLFLGGFEISDNQSAIWMYSDNGKNAVHKIYDGLLGGTIGDIVFDPLNSFLYFTQSIGLKYKVYQMDTKLLTVKTLKCDIVTSGLAIKFQNNIKSVVLAISNAGLIDVEDCVPASGFVDIGQDVKSVANFAVDSKKLYLATSSEILVYDISSSKSDQLDSACMEMKTYCPGCQVYPDSACLAFPSTPHHVSVRPVGLTSMEVIIVAPEWPSECSRVSRPATIHIVTIKPTSETSCNQNSRCFEKETSNSSILLSDLSRDTEYELTIFGYNAYNSKKVLGEPVKFKTSVGSELSAPQQLQAYSLTPDKIRLVWSPPKSASNTMKYAISQIGNSFQSLAELNFTINCSKEPCQEIVDRSLKPSTNYTFSVFAKTEKQTLEEAMQSGSNQFSVRTFDLPGTFVEQQPNKSVNSLTFVWSQKSGNGLKTVNFSYKKWKDFPQGFQQSNGKLYTIDHLDPDTQYTIRYVAYYETNFVYNGQNLPVYNGSFELKSTSVTLPVNREPDAPINLQIVTFNNETFLNWTKPFDGGKDISSYTIEYKLDENSNWTMPFGRFVSGNLQTAIKIPQNIQLTPSSQFRVKAKNSNGFSLPAIISVQSQSVDGGKSKSNAIGIIVGVAIACLIALILITIGIAVRRRRSQKPRFMTSANNSATPSATPNVNYAAGTENDEFQSVKQISSDDIKTLPHVPRSCITISKLLGSGAFGEVFEGLAYNLQRTGNQKTVRVAVKTLRPGSSDIERVKFLKEAVLMKNLDHPNIVRLLGVCLESEPHWIVLELMEGGSLLHYLRSVRPSDTMPSHVSLKDLVNISLDVAKGCHYLEHIRHVHRDLASRNCLISSRDSQLRQVKIADFGLARDVYDDDYYRVEGHGLLPVRWMAPESLLDGLFTTKTDVWSFGVLLWEIMTLGKQPYSGKTNWDVINFVRLGGRLEKPECCLDEIYQIMVSCWAFDGAARPSFAKLVLKLENLKLLDQFVNDSPYPPFYLNSRPSSQTTPENSQSKTQSSSGVSNQSSQAPIFATRSSARFSRKKPETQSARPVDKGKGFGFLSLRKKKEHIPPPPLPTKEQLANSPRNSNRSDQSQLRPDSGTSGHSYTTNRSLVGYEVPLLKNLKSNARIYDGAQNPAYERFGSSNEMNSLPGSTYGSTYGSTSKKLNKDRDNLRQNVLAPDIHMTDL